MTLGKSTIQGEASHSGVVDQYIMDSTGCFVYMLLIGYSLVRGVDFCFVFLASLFFEFGGLLFFWGVA